MSLNCVNLLERTVAGKSMPLALPVSWKSTSGFQWGMAGISHVRTGYPFWICDIEGGGVDECDFGDVVGNR